MRLPYISDEVHKGEMGKALIIGGSKGLSGAVVLCALGCLKSGIGLLRAAIPESIHTIFKSLVPECMGIILEDNGYGYIRLKNYSVLSSIVPSMDVICIGPGIGRNFSTKRLIEKILENFDLPYIIDADAIYLLRDSLSLLKSRDIILTPHCGEMSYLTGFSPAYINKNKKELAKDFAEKYEITLVLKGKNTIVANKQNFYINATGNKGMATGGMGDVLAGIITSFRAQGMDSFSASKWGVYIHGKAADIMINTTGYRGLLPTDVIQSLGMVIKDFEQ